MNGVRVVRDSIELPRDAVPLAEITTWRPADAAYSPKEDLDARRKRAAKVGATILLLRHDPAVQWQAVLSSHASLALFSPSDSSRVRDACKAK
jgi:hypothetical protein